MKVLLSLAGLGLAVFTIMTDPMSTMMLAAACMLIALCVIGLIYWGSRSTLPGLGHTVYYGAEPYVIVATFPSFFDIPEAIKQIPGPRLKNDRDMMKPFLIIVRSGSVVLTPYYSTVNHDHSEQDRRTFPPDQSGAHLKERIAQSN